MAPSADDGGHGAIAALVTDDGGRSAVLFRPASTPQGWQTVRVRLPDSAIYVSASAPSKMRVLVAYSATLVNGAETHPGTLFLIESDDSGGTWSTPRTVWTRDGMEAIEPQFVVAPSGRAHLIWRDARPNQIGEGGVWLSSRQTVVRRGDSRYAGHCQ